MHSDHIEIKDEEIMTDLQFLEYKRVRDELEILRREIETLRGGQDAPTSSGMTDYQFRKFNEILDESNALREENVSLKKGIEKLKTEKSVSGAPDAAAKR